MGELDADALAKLRRQHRTAGMGQVIYCVICLKAWPCPVRCLLDRYDALTADLARERDRADKAEGEANEERERRHELKRLFGSTVERIEVERDRLAAEVETYREELRDLLWQCPPCDGTGILSGAIQCYVCAGSRDVLAPLGVELKAPWPPSAAREGEGTDG